LNHWFAIRQVGGRFWNLDSVKELPVVVSHFQLATAMQTWAADGYTIFCVKQGLPVGGVRPRLPVGAVSVGTSVSSKQNNGAGAGAGTAPPPGNWHRMTNLLRGRHTAADPWQGVGSGMRLDGGNTTTTTSTTSTSGSSKPAAATNNNNNNNNGEGFMASASASGLTEDEQLQMALQASMEPASAPAPPTTASATATTAPMARVVSGDSLPPLPPEPKAGQPGTVRIQFRLPGIPKACVRRFDETDSVLCVYAYCHETLLTAQAHANNTNGGSHNHKLLQLKYGFPPRDLASQQEETIGSAGLGGQSLTGRYL
jgi:ataxin-3